MTHFEALQRLDLEAGVAGDLARYLDLLERWDRRIDLTGVRGSEARVQVLVQAALSMAPYVMPGRLLDIGSGNGSPGLVLALLEPGAQVTLLEPRLKRWAFLREACRMLGRADIRVLRSRHDGYQGPPAQTLTIRALRLPLQELAGLVVSGGRAIVFGGGRRAEGPFELEADCGPGRPAQVFRRQCFT